jgi:hypothetical protein
MPVIPAIRRLREEATLGYILRSCLKKKPCLLYLVSFLPLRP